jgi:hypothetical protein
LPAGPHPRPLSQRERGGRGRGRRKRGRRKRGRRKRGRYLSMEKWEQGERRSPILSSS